MCLTLDTVVEHVGHLDPGAEEPGEGGEVGTRAQRGERLTITRAGKPVAQLVALPRPPAPLGELQRRWAKLPLVDPEALRRDIDDVIDPEL